MKTSELKKFMAIAAVGLLVSACGSSSSDEEDVPSSVNSPAVNTGSQSNNNNNNNNQTTSPTPTPSTNGCPAYPAQSYYSYSISGSGTGSASTPSNQIVADSKLRVSIEPKASTNIQNKYTLLAGTVTLIRTKNGVSTAVESKTFPSPSTQAGSDYYSYKVGVPVGYKTNPSKLDFSANLAGDYKYSIKVSGVLTDKKCTDLCSPNSAQYAGHCAAYGSGMDYYCSAQVSGFVWTLDYLKNQWYCCDDSSVKTCQQTYCGVGNLTGLSNAAWSVTVRVETDNTSCIE